MPALYITAMHFQAIFYSTPSFDANLEKKQPDSKLVTDEMCSGPNKYEHRSQISYESAEFET